MSDIINILAALSDPTRRLIFEKLVDGPLPVGTLAAGLPVSRPAVSQHLKVLKEAGLVGDESLGTRRIYRIEPEGLAVMRAWLDRFRPGTPSPGHIDVPWDSDRWKEKT